MTWLQKYFTLDIWRWGLQAMISAVLTSMLVVIPQLNELFQGSGYWAVSSAVVVLEATTGGSIKKCFERIGGTFMGGLTGFGLFTLVTWDETFNSGTYERIALLVVICLFPLPWGYIREKFPKNPLISVYGVMTGYIVIVSAYLRGNAFGLALLRMVAVSTGVLVSSIVVHVVFPRRARVEVKKGLADVLLSIADILEPLIKVSAGLTPLEMLHVIQPVSDKLKEITQKKYELHEKRSRHKKKLDLKGSGSKTSMHGTPSVPTTQTLESPSPGEEEGSQKVSGVGSFVRKLSTNITGFFRQNTMDSPPTGGVDKETGNTDPFEIDGSKSALRILPFRPDAPSRKEPQLGAQPPEDTRSTSPPEIELNSPRLPDWPHSPSSSHLPDLSQQTQMDHARHLSYTRNVSFSGIDMYVDPTRDIRRSGGSSSEEFAIPSPDSSIGSCPSVFYRDQSLQLNTLRATTLRDVAARLTVSFEVEEKQRKERWAKTMEQFVKCQKLLTAQSALLIEARQEISFRGPTVFPYEKYQSALKHVQALFHHIASLFFSLDLQLTQVAQARRQSYAAFHKPEHMEVNVSSRLTFAPFDDFCASEDPENQKRIYAGMTAALENTEVFGHIVVEAMVEIRDALKGLAQCVLSGESVEDSLALVDAAARAIAVLNDLRRQRNQMVSKIFTTAIASEHQGKWIPPLKSSSQTVISVYNRPEVTLPWETLMGIEPHVFQEMTPKEHEAYWSNFWRARDKLSVTNGTLMLLRDQLYVLCEVIKAISAKEKQKIADPKQEDKSEDPQEKGQEEKGQEEKGQEEKGQEEKGQEEKGQE